jgi:hypothetical protein
VASNRRMDDELGEIRDLATDYPDYLLRSATRASNGFEIKLDLIPVGGPEEANRGVTINCENLLDFGLRNELALKLELEYLELTRDHPLLWKYHYDSGSAFFSGVPNNPLAAIGALYQAHWTTVGDWFGLDKYLNCQMDLITLLNTGSGNLAYGPVPLLEAYRDALSEHGIQVEIVARRAAGEDLVPELRQIETESKVLLMSESFVIGYGWKLV